MSTVCVVGSGGREHALVLALGRTADVVVTPGNPGTVGVTPEGHTVTRSGAPPEEIEADLYVIGPEAPLVDGLADRLRAAGRLVFGPGADGARLEGSKAFMKELLSEAGVPTARYGAFTDPVAAKEFCRSLPGPWVVKTDGLAAGKGVLVSETLADADADIEAKLSGESFGSAGRRVVVEEGLTGPECSLLVLCDGERLAPLAPSQDFKRRDDGDGGPNTGGMGAYSPVPFVDDRLVGQLVDEAVAPLLGAMGSRSIDYRGVLYAGLMLTPDGPKVLEFNVRFGDPEAQVVLPRLQGDVTGLFAEVAAGSLRTEPRFADRAAVCVVCASDGYPESPRTGDPIAGLDAAAALDGVTVLHAGTAQAEDGGGPVVTAGGRVLGIVGEGPTLGEARERAYGGVSAVSWPGMHARSDIALEAATPTGSGDATTAAARATPAPSGRTPRRETPQPETASR